MELWSDASTQARRCGVLSTLEALEELTACGGNGGGAGGARRLEAALARLAARTPQGLPSRPLHLLARSWLRSTSLAITKWSQIGSYLVPEEKVSDETILLVIHWIQCNYYNVENAPKVLFALSWLQGLMEYNLLNIEILNMYFDFFYFMLNCDKFSAIAAKFIYVLSKPHDVTRARVLNILRISKMQRQAKYYNALYAVVNLFKSFKPEYVPENVPVISVHSVFPKINKLLIDGFQQAQTRLNIQRNLMSEGRLAWWSSIAGPSNKKLLNFLIPNVEYIQLGSTLYTDYLERKKCIEFQSTKELLLCNLGESIDTPSNILSLLVNDAGLHMILFSDDNLKSRFSHVLYQTLYNNFLEKSVLSYEEKKSFLERLCVLQKYLLQGIPVISRFLAIYISSWDGYEFSNEIFSLLEWITFDSFEELYDCVLEHIETLYLTNNVYYCCSIINMLTMMYVRLHQRMISNGKQFFLSRKKTYDDEEVLTNLTDFINDLCEKSQREIQTSAILRNTFLDAYTTISKLQTNCAQPLWTVAPMSITYGTLCSLSAFSINRILGLILKYRLIYEKIKATQGKDNIKQQIMLTQNYSTDLMNCLWIGESINLRQQGLLLSMVPIKMIDHMDNVIGDCNKFLHFRQHIAFAPYTYMQMELEIDDNQSSIPPIFQNVSKFIEAVLNQ